MLKTPEQVPRESLERNPPNNHNIRYNQKHFHSKQTLLNPLQDTQNTLLIFPHNIDNQFGKEFKLYKSKEVRKGVVGVIRKLRRLQRYDWRTEEKFYQYL